MAQAFTKNHRDHSNDTGFQFEFFCDKCGNGHRSSFKANAVGIAGKLFRAAGSLFGGGGVLAGAGQAADQARAVDQTEGVDLSVKAIAQCPSCDARVMPGAKFCPECGKPTATAAAKAFCPECGALKPAPDKFCPGCGARPA